MRKMSFLLFSILFLFLSANFTSAAMVSGETAIIDPIHDATVSETDPDLNENSNFLRVYAGVGESDYNQWSYAQFDLSNIPDNATITNASIKWYIFGYSVSVDSTNRHIDFWHVDDDSWDESTLTWNNKPGYGYSLGQLTPTTYIGIYTFQIITSGSGVTDWAQPDLADNFFSMAMNTPPDDHSKSFVGYSGELDCGDGGCFHLELEYSYDDAIATAVTDPATSVTAKSAVLNGTINPNGQTTTCYFDFGVDTNYGDTISGTDPGSGSSGVPVTAQVSGISPDTTYHYRVVATNSAGTAYGSDQTFTTGSLSSAAGIILLLFQ